MASKVPMDALKIIFSYLQKIRTVELDGKVIKLQIVSSASWCSQNELNIRKLWS